MRRSGVIDALEGVFFRRVGFAVPLQNEVGGKADFYELRFDGGPQFVEIFRLRKVHGELGG